ncbi:alpha/beta hydrolase family protein [Comamonas testosteroni]|uniref:alpha/beta hydrolase family protein n=2 Tax=Comamonas TaxID=283 RepID=UPI0025FEFC22|nr:alpha/beta hydrolase [Comamonas testosteroni]MEB5964616.1 alpha/beta hydrolase [Comamonas testosteroni]
MTDTFTLKFPTLLGVLLLAALTPFTSAAQGNPLTRTANNMTEFCGKGQAEYPGGIARMHPSFKFNLCWWLEDAGIDLATFDEVAGALPDNAGPLHPAWQAIFGKAAQLHLEKAHIAEDRGEGQSASAEYRKAAFYWRLNRLPKQTPAADLQATERAYAVLGQPLQRVRLRTGEKEFVGYFRARPAQSGRNEKPPVLVILGGLDNLKTEMIRHSDYFMGRGFATLVVENPDTGENPLEFRPESSAMLDTVADYIRSRGDLDTGRVAVYGWSMGGYLGTLGGLRNDIYKAVVNIGGPSDSSFGPEHCEKAPAWIVAPYTVFANMNPLTTPRQAMCRYYEAFRLSSQLKMPSAAQLRKPILMVNGAREDLVSGDEPASLAALGFNVTQLVYGEDGHTAESHMREHLEFTANWLLQRLRAGD